MKRRNQAVALVVLEGVAIISVPISVTSHDVARAILSVAASIAIPLWVLAIEVPSRCGVTTLKGTSCRHPTTGIIFGCGSPGHTWGKVFSRFGWRRQVFPSPASSGRFSSDAPRPAQDESSVSGTPVLVRIEESAKTTVAFWATLSSTLAGLISAGVEVANLWR